MRALLALFVLGGAMAQEPAPGLKLTVESVADKVTHSQRVRLLALHVERRESPAPFLPPGMFKATFTGTLPVPLQDKYRFQATGKGNFQLLVNGKVALEGQLVTGNTIESAPVRLKKGANEIVATIESSALGEATLRLHWSLEGAFGWEPPKPELWHCADDADLQQGDLLAEGQTLFAARRCAHCHAPTKALAESAFGELAVMGPDLRTAGARLSPAWVAQWLQDPRKLHSSVRMPRLPGVGKAEAEHMAAWLAAAGAPPAPVTFTGQQADQGAVRFRELGCIGCHLAPGDTSAVEGRLELRNVTAKWHSKGLVEWLQNPRSQHPDSRMPDFALNDEDAAALAAFLLRGREGEPTPVRGGDASLGKQLAAKAGCMRCHAADTPDAATFAPLQGLDGNKGCLADTPPATAPDHALTPRQRQALRAFLPHAQEAPFRKVPADFAARQVRELRCTACHGLDGVPSAWAGFAHPAGVEPPPKTEDPVAQGVPALTWAGGKLQPSWMEKFVTGRTPSPRPWLTSRMPRFHHDGPAVVQGLARQHGYAFQDEPPGTANALVAHGARLVKQAEGLSCVDCHAIGTAPAKQVFEREGVNLQLAVSRVRHEYFQRWMLDAQRIDADSRMPKWTDATGRQTALKDVLGGDAVQQFEAIWQYLQTLR